MVAILDQLVERLLNTEEDVGSSFETKKKYIPLFLLFLLIFADFKAFLSHKQPPTKTKKGHYRHIRWSWSQCARIGPASETPVCESFALFNDFFVADCFI